MPGAPAHFIRPRGQRRGRDGRQRGSPGGRLNVTALARRTAIEQKTVSHHLALLRTAGLVFPQRRGRFIFQELAEGRVVFRRDADGRFSLTVCARAGGRGVGDDRG